MTKDTRPNTYSRIVEASLMLFFFLLLGILWCMEIV